MAYYRPTSQSAVYLLTIIIVCFYFITSNSVGAALKLECSNSFEQENRSFTAISVFNKSTFSFLEACQKNLSLLNVSVEMRCLFDAGKSDCQSRLRFSWTFETTAAQGLLKDVSVTLLQLSPHPGRWQDLNCHVVFYDYDDDYDGNDDNDGDNDDDYTQPSSLEILVMDFDCCDVDQGGHGYFAILKATYDDILSCKVGTQLTLTPAHLTSKEDEIAIPRRPTDLPPGEDDPNADAIAIPTVGPKQFSSVRAAIVITFVVVVCVVLVIVAYLCIRRRSHNNRRLAEREISTQPFDLNNGSDMENLDNNSYLHNCPHCVNETINQHIPDEREILFSSGSDFENREEQLDSGFNSGGPMFTSSDRMRTFAAQL